MLLTALPELEDGRSETRRRCDCVHEASCCFRKDVVYLVRLLSSWESCRSLRGRRGRRDRAAAANQFLVAVGGELRFALAVAECSPNG